MESLHSTTALPVSDRCPTCGRGSSSPGTDPLTGLLDRDGWNNALIRFGVRKPRRGLMAALIIIDLDRFKKINDQFGHLAGDVVLRAVAEVLRRSVRETDMVGRYGGHGGDEFLVLTPDTDIAGAMGLAHRICRGINQISADAQDTAGIPVTINELTASAGIALQRPDDALLPDELVRHADAALLLAKQSGRNVICHAGELRATGGGT